MTDQEKLEVEVILLRIVELTECRDADPVGRIAGIMARATLLMIDQEAKRHKSEQRPTLGKGTK